MEIETERKVLNKMDFQDRLRNLLKLLGEHPPTVAALESMALESIAVKAERDRLQSELNVAIKGQQELERRLKIAEIKAAHSLANNLCADHRDKQAGKNCLACTIEQLKRKVA